MCCVGGGVGEGAGWGQGVGAVWEDWGPSELRQWEGFIDLAEWSGRERNKRGEGVGEGQAT